MFKNGALPSGEPIVVTVEEIMASYLVTGRGLDLDGWSVSRRRLLVRNLARVVDLFRETKMVSEIFVNGSFVEAENAPTDIDCYFVLHDNNAWFDGRFETRLSELDPEGGWDWDHLIDCGAETPRHPFWARYFIDIYPELGDYCGLKGRSGDELTFSQAFRQRTLSGKPKGILRIRVS